MPLEFYSNSLTSQLKGPQQGHSDYNISVETPVLRAIAEMRGTVPIYNHLAYVSTK